MPWVANLMICGSNSSLGLVIGVLCSLVPVWNCPVAKRTIFIEVSESDSPDLSRPILAELLSEASLVA
jgi:hypothetical protein